MKKIKDIAVILVIMLAMFLAACGAGKQDSGKESGMESGPLCWELSEDGTLTISGHGSMEVWEKSREAYPWAEQRDQVRAVIIEDGVTDIGKDAFCECHALKNVTISGSVEIIGEHAFDRCDNLVSIELPYGISEIKEGCFRECSSLRDITIPGSVSFIGPFAFHGCSSLTEVSIPASVTYYGQMAFGECGRLTAFHVDPENEKFYDVDGVVYHDMNFRTYLIDYPDGLKEQNRALVPAELTGDVAPPAGELDASVLSDSSIRVLPLYNNGSLYYDLFAMLPEERRAVNSADADYALVYDTLHEECAGYFWSGTSKSAKSQAFATITKLYLCAPDGEYSEIFSVKYDPPNTGTPPLYGPPASAELIWGQIKDLFGE